MTYFPNCVGWKVRSPFAKPCIWTELASSAVNLFLKKGSNLTSMSTGKKIYSELENIAAVWLAGIRDQKFVFSDGGNEGDVTSNGICGLPLEWGTKFRSEDGGMDPLEVGAARTSLKNRAGRGKGEEGDRGSDLLSREHLRGRWKWMLGDTLKWGGLYIEF